VNKKRVIIVGGGLAGMSAAEALARHGGDRFEISLLESKRATGGRAGSFTDPATGETVDYCQHVAMGCCTNLIGLLERCGLADSMHRYTELQFFHPEHPPSRFAASRFLPAPLHLARTVAGLRYLNRGQQRQIRNGLWRLLRCPSNSLHGHFGGDWLRANGQDAETIRIFWDVIVVSALGERTDVVAMSAVRKVFVDGFAVARGASDVLVPTLPLAELFGRRLFAAIAELGVRLLTGMPVTSVAERFIETGDGTRYDAEHVIVAVPWHAIASLMPHVELPGLDRYDRIPASPITGIHLWFDREITDRPHAVMVGTLAQWLFRQPFPNRSSNRDCYYQVVISASHHSRTLPKEQLVETVLGELRDAFPAAKDAKLVRSRIVTDPKSVFSIRPEVNAIRPAAQTPLPWLHLAGDWIATGWPATMEGAVISGRMAASSVAGQENLPPIEIDPGLPRGWLSRSMVKS
jgi:squalene-associated FAD-dependent desaturase